MKRIWVDVTAEGLNLERMIRTTAAREIPLRRLRRTKARQLTALVPEDRLAELNALTQQGGWRLLVGRRHGVGRALDTLSRQWLLVCFLLLAMAGALMSSQVMWRVALVDPGIYRADIASYLDELGLRAPMWKHDVDLTQLRDALEWRYPDIARVDCGWRGMTLRISVHAGDAEGETFTAEGSGNVTALRDGVVDSVVTVAGTAQVKAGDLVRKGQVLILGEERNGAETVRAVAARGTVMARVWDGASVRMPLSATETIYSGRMQTVQTVETPFFDLWQPEDAGFESMDTHITRMPLGGLFFPLVIRTEQRLEARAEKKTRELSEVKAEAGLAALRRLRQKVGSDAPMLDKWVEYSMIEDGELQAIAVCERVIDIAQRAP